MHGKCGHICFSNIFAFAHTLLEMIINSALMLNLLFCTIPNFLRFYSILITGRSWVRIPVGARFSAPVKTGPEAHPASYTMGTGSFPGVERSGRGVDHPPPSSTKVKERVELYLYFSSGTSWTVIG
jgi:hypothetical protein